MSPYRLDNVFMSCVYVIDVIDVFIYKTYVLLIIIRTYTLSTSVYIYI